jgi:hypothetical protein
MTTQPLIIAEPTSEDVASLTGRSVVFNLQISSPRFVRKISTSEVAPDEDADLFHVSKDLIDQDALKAIRRHASQFKGWMRSKRAVSCSLLRGGMYLIPAELVVDVDSRYQAWQKERDELVDSFILRYDALKTDARRRLGPKHYRDQEYPAAGALVRAFAVTSGFLSIDVPKALERVDSKLFEREQARVESDWKEAWAEIRDAVRVSFAELIEHLAERLLPGEDGKRRVLRDSAVDNLHEFLDTFSARNLTNDSELEALAAKARAVIAGVGGDELRSIDVTRDRVIKGIGEIRRGLDGIVITAPRRQMSRGGGRA